MLENAQVKMKKNMQMKYAKYAKICITMQKPLEYVSIAYAKTNLQNMHETCNLCKHDSFAKYAKIRPPPPPPALLMPRMPDIASASNLEVKFQVLSSSLQV